MRGRRVNHRIRQSEHRILTAVVLTAAVLCALFAAGCGKQETIPVTVRDRNVTTQMETAPGQTVAEVLEEAEIRVGEKDRVVPAQDEKVNAGSADIVVQRYARAVVMDEDKKTKVELFDGKVSDALKEAKLSLGEDDYIDCDPDDYVADGMKITVTRVRHITLTVNGKERKIKTTARTVKELFKEQKIKVGKRDRLNVKETAKLKDGAKIVLDLVNVKEEIVTEDIPYSTETHYSAAMNKGTSKVTRSGSAGKKEVTYRVTIVNGREESREKVSEKVIKQPVSEIVTQGTKAVRTVVSRQAVYDCDGSGHGYYIIKYSDGTTEYQEF